MEIIKKNLLQIALFQTIIAMIGSLYFSEFMKLPPCTLCWYQRICMYPLVLIFSVAIWKKDKNVIFYSLPLSVIGTIIAFYHNLLYYGIIPESSSPCVLGISCTTKQIEWFGFITIPLLSLFAFISITLLILLFKKYSSDK